MPRLVYTPDGSETPKTWDFSFGRLLSPERIAIEKMTGLGWASVQEGFFQNHGTVIHALLFVLLKREVPTLRPEEVVFCDDEIDLDLLPEERKTFRDTLLKKAVLSEAEADALRELEADLDESAEGDASPKED